MAQEPESLKKQGEFPPKRSEEFLFKRLLGKKKKKTYFINKINPTLKKRLLEIPTGQPRAG